MPNVNGIVPVRRRRLLHGIVTVRRRRLLHGLADSLGLGLGIGFCFGCRGSFQAGARPLEDDHILRDAVIALDLCIQM